MCITTPVVPLDRLSWPAGWEGLTLAGGDLDSDGWVDLVVAHRNSISILRNEEGLGFTAATYPTPGGPFDIALGDLNGDHRLDIVTSNGRDGGSKLSIFLNATTTVSAGMEGAGMALLGARLGHGGNTVVAEYRLPEGLSGVMEVYDVSGRRWGRASVRASAGAGARVLVETTASLGAGVYFGRLSAGNRSVTRRFVVTR